MDGISEKIKELLNDEESMQQIKELAELLNGGAPASDEENGSAECFDPDFSDGKASSPAGAGFDISGLMSALSGGNGCGVDMDMIMKLTEILNSTSADDVNRAFLLALRPLLSEDKQHRIDKAVKFLRLYAVFNAAKKCGLINRLGDIF